MKKMNLLLCAVAMTAFGVTSCSDDDSDNTNNDVIIAGTYSLTEYNTASPTDFDMDGDENTNQKLESDCYDGSKIILNADSTLTYYINDILIDPITGSDGCQDYSAQGTWEITSAAGQPVVITATYQNPNGTTATRDFVKDGAKLTSTTIAGLYPDRNAQGGAVYAIGAITMVYTK